LKDRSTTYVVFPAHHLASRARPYHIDLYDIFRSNIRASPRNTKARTFVRASEVEFQPQGRSV
jgi:hypothetical protein